MRPIKIRHDRICLKPFSIEWINYHSFSIVLVISGTFFCCYFVSDLIHGFWDRYWLEMCIRDSYCKGYGMMIGLCVGYEYQFGKRWLLDAFLGWAWMDSHYNGYSFDGQVDMYPHRPVQPEHPDPFNGSSEWYPNKIGVSIGYRIFTPRNKQRTADVR